MIDSCSAVIRFGQTGEISVSLISRVGEYTVLPSDQTGRINFADRLSALFLEKLA